MKKKTFEAGEEISHVAAYKARLRSGVKCARSIRCGTVSHTAVRPYHVRGAKRPDMSAWLQANGAHPEDLTHCKLEGKYRVS